MTTTANQYSQLNHIIGDNATISILYDHIKIIIYFGDGHRYHIFCKLLPVFNDPNHTVFQGEPSNFLIEINGN